MNWLHYLLEANLYLVLFYAGYCLFLNKETYYTLNRVYLLLSCILSFLLPLMQIGVLKPVESGVVKVMIVAPASQQFVSTKAASSPITLDNILLCTYLLGVIVLALMLLFKIFKLIKMTRTTMAMVDNKYKLIGIEGSNTAFSFFNYLFIGSKTTGSDIIIRHELVHIRQKHSADIIFMEIIKIINWFNPFIYLMQVSLKTVHEYIADEQTAALETDALAYSSFLVNNAYGLNGASITHSFFNYNLLKKRIIMLNQKRSGNLARLKFLMTVPICAAALCASTLGFSKSYALIDLVPRKIADTTKVWSRSIDNVNGVKLDEIGSVVNNKTDFEVTITDKQGNKKSYRKSTASAEDKKLLLEKYRYTFPDKIAVPKPPAKIANMPPPPPPANPAKGLKSAPKVKRDVKVTNVELLPPPPAPEKPVEPAKEAIEQKMPPPPPPQDPFDSLYKYVARHVRYPAAEREHYIGGRIILAITIKNGKIDDVKFARALTDNTNAEVMRVIKNYDGPLGIKSGYYSMPVTFAILDEHDNQVAHTPENNTQKNKIDSIEGDLPQYSMNEVVIVSYPSKKQ